MTNSEAIKILEEVKTVDDSIYQYNQEYTKALDMAIKTLEQQSCEDCISREQLNKLYNKYRPFLATRVCEFGEKLKELPSVQPIATDNNVLTCEDCISRQAAIDCLNADFTIDGKENMETVVDYINGAFKQIKALPSVTPKPFINKPCVSEGVCREDKIQVLDKIRAEITDWQNDIHDNEYDAEKHDFVFERIFEIIDEYRERDE